MKSERATERNKQFVLAYLREHPCIDCGFSDVRALAFDHRDRAKKRLGVAYMVGQGYSLLAIQEEIAKCDVRCHNCHWIKTLPQMGWSKHKI